ncbi:MAG: SOS response-associated peptidase [Deltaproteobacteria bacterium]|nr:SOS response-associated peptidase [Deltaproteobacteria bacterium]
MCGRYTLTRQQGVIDDLEASLGASVGGEWWKPRYNVAPTQPAPVVTLHDGVRTIELMRWGLVPHWAGRGGPGVKAPPLMINARAESLDAKAVFRDALARRRCLVPADGFFEWKRSGLEGSGKQAPKPQPLYFHPRERRVFAFAGLWARSRTDAGELLSFTIITGRPNELVSPIHDRMPVVLGREAYAAWLDPEVDAATARELLAISPGDGWVAEPVSTVVNSAANDDPTCIAPITDEPAAQRSLF